MEAEDPSPFCILYLEWEHEYTLVVVIESMYTLAHCDVPG